MATKNDIKNVLNKINDTFDSITALKETVGALAEQQKASSETIAQLTQQNALLMTKITATEKTLKHITEVVKKKPTAAPAPPAAPVHALSARVKRIEMKARKKLRTHFLKSSRGVLKDAHKESFAFHILDARAPTPDDEETDLVHRRLSACLRQWRALEYKLVVLKFCVLVTMNAPPKHETDKTAHLQYMATTQGQRNRFLGVGAPVDEDALVALLCNDTLPWCSQPTDDNRGVLDRMVTELVNAGVIAQKSVSGVAPAESRLHRAVVLAHVNGFLLQADRSPSVIGKAIRAYVGANWVWPVIGIWRDPLSAAGNEDEMDTSGDDPEDDGAAAADA